MKSEFLGTTGIAECRLNFQVYTSGNFEIGHSKVGYGSLKI
jgi:hypothetical protein